MRMVSQFGLNGLGLAQSLDAFAQQIQRVEGYFAPGENSNYPSGTLAWRNNNPGNLRYTSYYAQNFGAQPGENGFSLFRDYATGYAALKHQISLDAGRGLTVLEMMNKYAPASDGNDPNSYAATVAAGMGVSVSAKVADVVGGGAATATATAPGNGGSGGGGLTAPGLLDEMWSGGGENGGMGVMGIGLALLAGLLLADVVTG